MTRLRTAVTEHTQWQELTTLQHGTELVLAYPLARGKAAICVVGLFQWLVTAKLQIFCRFLRLFFFTGAKGMFQQDESINEEILNRPNCSPDRHQGLAGISKETAVTNRGPRHRTRPLHSHCLNLHRLGLGAELGTHTWLKTWLPLQEYKRTQTSLVSPPTPHHNRQENLDWVIRETENIPLPEPPLSLEIKTSPKEPCKNQTRFPRSSLVLYPLRSDQVIREGH